MVKNRLDDKNLDFLRKDDYATDFLMIVYEEGGEADVKTLRYELGLGSEDKNVLNYRFKKLNDNNLIDIDHDENVTKGNRSPGKVAVLTDLGREVIQSDLVDPSDEVGKDIEELTLSKNNFEELKDEYQKVQNKLDVLEERISDVSENEDIDTDEIKNRLRKIEENLDPEYIENWMNVAQNYLDAIKNYLEMRDDVDLENYIDDNEDNKNSDEKENEEFEYVE